MKRILFFLLIISSGLIAQVTSLNTPLKLARWTAGNKLNAGTIGDTAQANASLNYNFDRINALWARQHDKDGWFTSIYGDSTANLIIGLAGSQHNKRVVLNDSLYGYYNWQTEGNLLVQGNGYFGGYLTTDSIIVSHVISLDSGTIRARYVTVTGSLTADEITASTQLNIGDEGGNQNKTVFWYSTFGPIANYSNTLYYRSEANVTDTLPGASGTIALVNGNQDFYDVGRVISDSIVSDNNYAVLYSDTKIAGSSAGDTSANFTTFLNTTNGSETKVRFPYVHRRGTANLKAFYQIRGTDVTAVQGKIAIYTLAGALVTSGTNNSTATSTYEEDAVSVSVATLTTDKLYEVRFITSGTAGTDIPETKTVTIISTSN